ncbi:hypothetical protein CHS0354_011419 [Potamilus streckersoni]|uniref:Uncharacterized protein n=1 Tax=Potamilus streckersoni TaxID=2493646 RepID=A0AAE0TG09_9BIVA|nr:hypothetical protein CHS0354_011419 [Potamilus streckersoni]
MYPIPWDNPSPSFPRMQPSSAMYDAAQNCCYIAVRKERKRMTVSSLGSDEDKKMQ